MDYDIYFHNDLDGRASAAVMLSFLRSRGDRIAHYIPMDHGKNPKWFNENYFVRKNPAIVVDFPYHPGAAWWFDHHEAPFKKEKWQKSFRSDKFHRYEPSYRSACHLVYASLKKDFDWKPPAHFRELVKWLDIIDSANYRSAAQAIALKEPALQVGIYADRGAAHGKENFASAWLIKLLADQPLAKVATEPEIKKMIRGFRKELGAGLAFAKKNMQREGRVAYVDFSSRNFRKIKEGLRYAPFMSYPDAPYAIRIMKDAGRYRMGVGINPWWRGKSNVNVGMLLKRYGGGGHKVVGGVDFKTHKAAKEALREIVAFINTH